MTKSLVVAVFVFPATSLATPAPILTINFPGVFTSTPEFVAWKVYEAPEPERVGPIVQEVEAASCVISLINKPVTDFEKVAVIV